MSEKELGRPIGSSIIPPQKIKGAAVMVWMTPDEKSAAVHLAKKHGVSLSEVVRQAVRQLVNTETKN